MNFIQFESAQKLRGGFYTPPDLVAFLTHWLAVARPERVLEPSCGDGAFLDALLQAGPEWPKTLCAFEINPAEAAKARERCSSPRLQLHVGDFLRWFLFHAPDVEPFDAVIGNPPFIRYQYLPEEQQFLAEKIFGRFQLPFTKHTNVWVPFVIASLALLKPGGRLAMVLPSEIFHIRHAQPLRTFLADRCSRVLVLDPDEIWFGDTLQGTVLLLAEKKSEPAEGAGDLAVCPIAQREELASDPEQLFGQAAYVQASFDGGKWMPLFLDGAERELLAQLRVRTNVRPFAELAGVDIGIVTGANSYFLVPDSVVQEFKLSRWAHPMFGRSEHVAGLIYGREDQESNRRAGLPSNFLWFQEEALESFPPLARQYIADGVAQGLPRRFKCAVRKPWYKVPSVYAAPVGMLKRAHHYPRLFLNQAGAYSTDTAYRVKPMNIAPEALVFAFVNSLTCLCAELEGRHYGGGVLELVPSEIERLLIPLLDCDGKQLLAADQAFRKSEDDLAFVQRQDAVVLGTIGITRQEQEALFSAWTKLRVRRQRSRNTEE